MEKTEFFSYKNGDLSRGCKLCVKGQKTVLFITGVCPRKCYFCPLSEQKFHKDVMYANERPVEDLKEIVEEIRVSGSKGCGITGGDPLAKFERTVKVIKMLKEEFGEHFHIHLYTSLNLVDDEKIKILEKVGLDEIRFHLDYDDESLWKKVKFETSMIKGVEVPVIPGKDVKKMIEFVKDCVDFVNLNELECADAEHNRLEEFEVKNDFSYAIKGSEKLALESLEEFPEVNVHYCTAKLKNTVQFMNRLALRAKNVKNEFDIVKGPALIRGVVTGGDVDEVYENVSKLFKCVVDSKKSRVLCSKSNAKKFAKKLKKKGYKVEVVEELASYDQFEIESEEV